jgi:peptide/nickel transport system substrate-binding protein/oligopeptide transport system substrate-binding protein
MYMADELDALSAGGVGGGSGLLEVMKMPDVADNVDLFSVFVTYYLFYQTDRPPFDDLRVRQAFSHAIDRETIANKVMQGLEEPAYTMLPPGMPCEQNYDPEIRAIQAYDPDLARQLLADAGYPNGEGFPELEVWTRAGTYVTQAEAIQRMLGDNLGITVEVKDVERALYMEEMRAHNIELGLVQWGADFVDPSNFLDWWANQSRHPWKNERFTELVNEARGELDFERRCELYHEAERILIEDVAGVFVGFPLTGGLTKPWVGGRVPDRNGVFRGSSMEDTNIYIKAH